MQLTDDDYQRAAIRMEQTGKDMLELHPGHHRGYLAEAYINTAKAYYHADSSNQRKMRIDFDTLFQKFHNLNKELADGS